MLFQTFIVASNKAASSRELVAVWQKAMADAGFDRVLFSLLTDHDAIERKAGLVVAVNFPKEWLVKYFVSGFGLMRQQMFAAEGAFGWDRLRKDAGLKALHAGLFNEGPSTGLYNGIGIPLRASQGAFSGITAAGSSDSFALNEDVLDHVRMLSQQFYKVFLKLEAKQRSGESVQLTCREQEILTWYSMGKTNMEISCILNITPRVVKFHLEGSFQKLNVRNGRVAVLKAASMGLIFPKYENG